MFAITVVSVIQNDFILEHPVPPLITAAVYVRPQSLSIILSYKL